jgi:hypothetical protein
MGMGAALDGDMHHPRQAQIRYIAPFALKKPRVFDSFDAFA